MIISSKLKALSVIVDAESLYHIRKSMYRSISYLSSCTAYAVKNNGAPYANMLNAIKSMVIMTASLIDAGVAVKPPTMPDMRDSNKSS